MKEYIHLHTGVDKNERAQARVSIMIKEKWKNYIKSWEPINERILKITIKLREHNILILGIYAPSDNATVTIKEEFEEIVENSIEQVPDTHEIIMIGDFNARVGKEKNSRVVGQHGEETINDNGERLIHICEQYDLKINNTFFIHKDIHKFTWYQHTRNLKSIIDYVITKQTSNIIVKGVRVKSCLLYTSRCV